MILYPHTKLSIFQFFFFFLASAKAVFFWPEMDLSHSALPRALGEQNQINLASPFLFFFPLARLQESWHTRVTHFNIDASLGLGWCWYFPWITFPWEGSVGAPWKPRGEEWPIQVYSFNKKFLCCLISLFVVSVCPFFVGFCVVLILFVWDFSCGSALPRKEENKTKIQTEKGKSKTLNCRSATEQVSLWPHFLFGWKKSLHNALRHRVCPVQG